MYELPPPYALRDVVPQDQSFLETLYFSSREDLHHVSDDPQVVRQLIQMQQRMQVAGLLHTYPDAAQWIVLRLGQAVGRVVVDVGPVDMRVVDMAVLPEARRLGAARAVLRALQQTATAQRLTVSLTVSLTNAPARKLYAGEGFVEQSHNGVMAEMRWSGPAA